MLLCQKIKDCDARFSYYWIGSADERKGAADLMEIFGRPVWSTFEKQARNKMIFDIGGNTYSGRFFQLLWKGSLLLKFRDFDDIATVLTKPYEHYLPVKLDAEDIASKIEWVRANDE